MFLGGPYEISRFSVKKVCFSVFLLNSTEDRDSKFNSGEQFHLMVPVSFPLKFKFKEQLFRVYRGQWDNSIILSKKSVFLCFHC